MKYRDGWPYESGTDRMSEEKLKNLVFKTSVFMLNETEFNERRC